MLRKLAGNNSRVYWVMGSDVVEDMMYYGEKATGLLAAVDFVVVFERQVTSSPLHAAPEESPRVHCTRHCSKS